jgi:hypothetical protein
LLLKKSEKASESQTVVNRSKTIARNGRCALRVPSFTLSLALSLAFVACIFPTCTHAQPDGAPKEPPPPVTQQPPERPPDGSELMYLTSKDGTVFLEVPREILADVCTELVRRGREDLARQLRKLYDLQTGSVRDLAHAKRVEAWLQRGKR